MINIKRIIYQIENDEMDKKIVVLADIHYYNKREVKYLNSILEELKTIQYDYLCIAGDLLDVSFVQDEEPLLAWLTELGRISKVIIGIGNHDLTDNRKTHEFNFNFELFAKIEKIKNVTVLDNEDIVFGNIRFIGLTLPVDYYYQYNENRNYFMRYVNNTFPAPYEDKYNILLCHSPVPVADSGILAKTKLFENIDLVLCGHMHGGATPKAFRKILKGRGVVGPYQIMFPKNCYGILTSRRTKIVISSGITTASHVNPFSFLDGMFMKEITIVDLIKKK